MGKREREWRGLAFKGGLVHAHRVYAITQHILTDYILVVCMGAGLLVLTPEGPGGRLA